MQFALLAIMLGRASKLSTEFPPYFCKGRKGWEAYVESTVNDFLRLMRRCWCSGEICMEYKKSYKYSSDIQCVGIFA